MGPLGVDGIYGGESRERARDFCAEGVCRSAAGEDLESKEPRVFMATLLPSCDSESEARSLSGERTRPLRDSTMDDMQSKVPERPSRE